MSRLLVAIVNFRTPELTLDCLRSIAEDRASVAPLGVVIADNGSGDGSTTAIEGALAHCRAWASLLPLGRNLGFAGGTNAAIRSGIERYGRPDYVLLLNSDTVVHPRSLRYCMDSMQSDSSVGVLSCRLLNPDGSTQIVARRFPSPPRLLMGATGLPWWLPSLFGWAQTEYRGWDMDREPGDPDWLGGAFLLCRMDLLDRIGLLDEEFFFYGEDMEFCHRVWRAGFRCHYDPQVAITHIGSSSSDPSRLDTSIRSVHAWRARYLYLRKCHGLWAASLVRVADYIFVCLRQLAYFAGGRTDDPRYATLRESHRILGRRLRVR